MPPVGFEPKILVSEQPQTHALDRTATGIGARYIVSWNTDNDICGEDVETAQHILRVLFPYPAGGNK
jgi:hypothetical protein